MANNHVERRGDTGLVIRNADEQFKRGERVAQVKSPSRMTAQELRDYDHYLVVKDRVRRDYGGKHVWSDDRRGSGKDRRG